MEFAKANLTPKAVSLRYFTKEREDHWKCKCGKVIQQKTNKGYSNLFNHIKGALDPDYADARDTSQPCIVNKKGRNAFSWIKWVFLGMKPFEFTENPLTRELGSNSQDSDSDFASLLIKKRRLQVSSQKVSEYERLKFLLPTSNILERFFSFATYSFSDLRQKLLPMNLEMQLFLKVNEKF